MVKEKILRPKKKVASWSWAWQSMNDAYQAWSETLPALRAVRMSHCLLSCDLTEKGSLSTCYTSECFHSLPLCP